MKLYGSLQNRLEEGKNFIGEIKVGTGVTEYGYSDRHPYEVVEVKDQKHIIIRAMDYIRVDNNGLSDAQSYKYISNENNLTYELVLRNNAWYRVIEYTKKDWEKTAKRMFEVDMAFKTYESAYRYVRGMSGLTDKQYEKVDNGGVVKKYSKMNISIGVMEKYFDYTF